MEIIAHAGCAGQYTENTLSALRQAAPHVDAIEIDIRRCGSGELVLFHDETLQKAAGIDQNINEISLQELRKITVFDSEEGIPTLSEALETVPTNVGINLELKETGLVADAKQLLGEYDHDVIVSSFSEQALKAVHQIDWQVQVGYLFDKDPIINTRTAAKLNCDVVHPHYELCLESKVVPIAQALGLGINAWTVTTSDTVRELTALGVDGVIVDRWDILNGIPG